MSGLSKYIEVFPSNSSFSPSSSTRSDLEQNLSLLLPFHLPAGYYCLQYFLFLLFFLFLFSCVVCGGFLSPHFLFSRLIGLHISMCCDSVNFDFIKPATTVARFIPHSCLFILYSQTKSSVPPKILSVN